MMNRKQHTFSQFDNLDKARSSLNFSNLSNDYKYNQKRGQTPGLLVNKLSFDGDRSQNYYGINRLHKENIGILQKMHLDQAERINLKNHLLRSQVSTKYSTFFHPTRNSRTGQSVDYSITQQDGIRRYSSTQLSDFAAAHPTPVRDSRGYNNYILLPDECFESL